MRPYRAAPPARAVPRAWPGPAEGAQSGLKTVAAALRGGASAIGTLTPPQMVACGCGAPLVELGDAEPLLRDMATVPPPPAATPWARLRGAAADDAHRKRPRTGPMRTTPRRRPQHPGWKLRVSLRAFYGGVRWWASRAAMHVGARGMQHSSRAQPPSAPGSGTPVPRPARSELL
jgi:hypothetical protein